MERSKCIVIFLLIIFSCLNIRANYKSDIYHAYIVHDMKLWVKVIDEMHLQKKQNDAFILELLNYQYGYIGWCIGVNKKDEAEKYLALAEHDLAVLERSTHQLSMISAYKSAFCGFRIGINKLKAPFIGPKSVSFAKLAIQQDAHNFFGYIQFGNTQYYMPGFFGGSKTVALEYFKKAEMLMAPANVLPMQDWNYLGLLTIIAQGYAETKNFVMAKAYFQKILIIEPDFLWVKNKLYPQFLQSIKK